MFFCASCAVKNCAKRLGEEGEYPRTCPTLRPQLAEVLREYEEPQTRLLAQASAISNLDHTESRVQQTVRFARNCGYKKLGIAFCITKDLRWRASSAKSAIMRENVSASAIPGKNPCAIR